MTDQQHSITIPPDLEEELLGLWPQEALQRAAQWGADQELEACCEWLRQFKPEGYVLAGRLRHRRFKPKSRKQRALDALTQMESQLDAELAIEIRNALEELPND